MRLKITPSLIAVSALVVFSCSSTPVNLAYTGLPEPNCESFEADMPKIKRPANTNKEYYSALSKRLGHYGRVWLGFSVNAQGRAEGISVVQTDFDDLAENATNMLRNLEFDVSKILDASDLSSRRYCIGFIFVLEGKPRPPDPPSKRPMIVITGSHFVNLTPNGVRSIQ